MFGGGGRGEKQLMEQIFSLRFTSKQLNRASRKCEATEKAEKNKVKRAIEKGNIEGAKVYAQNAIRKKSEALNYLQLASRLDGVVSRLDTQAKMNTVNRSMAGVVKSLEKALGANNLEMVSRTMDQFERQFESLDVQSECVEQAMASQQALSTPAGEVNELMQQVADEHGLELGMDLPTAERIVPEKEEESSLNDRLAQLKAR